MRNNFNVKAKFMLSSSLVAIVVAFWCSQLSAQQTSPSTSFFDKISNNKSNTKTKKNIETHSLPNIPNIDKKVLELAVKAYNKAIRNGYGKNEHLTIVDYSMPSTERRMWVIDMRNKSVVHNTHVAHGIGSGQNYAYRFSNRPGSGMSSLGVFLTGGMYNGKFGRSLVLHGLEDKFNSNAMRRRIVMHKAHYVDEHVISKIGRLGRSLGCLALNTKIADKVMQTIKDGSLIFCYYPDEAWLKESNMLRA
jgi:hypothetical protein